MKRFQNLLVGVDLASADRLVGDEIGAPSRCAVERALWLAEQSGASVRFAYALDVSPAAEAMIRDTNSEASNVFEAANAVLAGLINEARARGVTATSHVLVGRSWMTLIQEVLREGHDLVVAGTRDAGLFDRIQLGSTGIKLLRKCPCPVWITKPGIETLQSILVAHDLTPVGAYALELGASLSNSSLAELHILHAVEHHALHSWFSELISVEEVVSRRREANDEIELQMATIAPGTSYTVHLSDDRPAHAIASAIDEYAIDLVVMGTVARTGVHGLLVGNTAERLLPVLPCSVLAVKPDGFVCPIRPSE